jgi:hypothetical protein
VAEPGQGVPDRIRKRRNADGKLAKAAADFFSDAIPNVEAACNRLSDKLAESAKNYLNI